jgi:hypothetical protein
MRGCGTSSNLNLSTWTLKSSVLLCVGVKKELTDLNQQTALRGNNFSVVGLAIEAQDFSPSELNEQSRAGSLPASDTFANGAHNNRSLMKSRNLQDASQTAGEGADILHLS